MRRLAVAVGLALAVLAALASLLYALSWGLTGRHEGPGTISGPALPANVVAARAKAAPGERQILFGDLHAHTTFSTDAFATSLPVLGGVGTNPPAHACDFARYCAALDFWSINDHASNLTPRHWRETREAIRACNERAGDPDDPDLVSFLGWEWTQVGQTPDAHYGHKNVIVLETADALVPPRPLSEEVALRVGGAAGPGAFALLDPDGPWQRYFDFARYMRERDAVPRCPADGAAGELSEDCREVAPTPADLFRKLRAWGGEAIVIPHGTSWGFYTPAGSSWDKQLAEPQHDPELQILFEVYSGHGNSEEYRDWRAVESGPDGSPRCPEPSPGYLPSCWRAGEILAARCRAAGQPEQACDEVAAVTRRRFLDHGNRGFQIVPGQEPDDWLDAGQCTDCFLPAFNLRPRNSAQYALAAGARYGFLAASDGHKAKPGIGYKETRRAFFADGIKVRSPEAAATILARGGDRTAWEPIEPPEFGGFGTFEIERTSAFMTVGGLTAVHAAGRDRRSIWDALRRREVYGTSGTKILLWFDLLNAPGGPLPMGGAAELAEAPRFRVRALGSFRQRPGCPDHAREALGEERLALLCANECDHPGAERKRVTRIEVVRIRPRRRADEPVGALIEDPWRALACPASGEGCVVEFSDPELAAGGRESVYYVRAIEEPGPVVNADGLRCQRDAEGRCVALDACYQDWRTDPADDCLGEAEERAWSSPITVGLAGAG